MKSMTLIFDEKEIKLLTYVKKKYETSWKKLFLALATKEVKGGKK